MVKYIKLRDSIFFIFKLWKYETYLQETWKIQKKVTLYIAIIFKVDKLRFVVGISISNSQKLIEWIDRKVEEYSRPENHCEPIQFKIYTVSHSSRMKILFMFP